MAFATSQQLARYFDLYQNIDVTFSKEVIKATGLVPEQVFIKSLGNQWPCVINSTSLTGAKIIVGAKSGVVDKIQQGNSSVNLRFCFRDQSKNDVLTFFVAGKVAGAAPYAGSSELVLISIAYTQRPPDDLIEILGVLLEANINSAKRREERITVTAETMRKIGIVQKETLLFVQGVPRRCILRDVSFSGSKVIMVGLAPFLANKDVVLRIDLDEPRTAVGIKGRIVRTEDVEGRKDLVAVAIMFNENEVPMAYKMHINNYISQQSKVQMTQNRGAQQQAGKASGSGQAEAQKPDQNGRTGAVAATAATDVATEPETLVEDFPSV